MPTPSTAPESPCIRNCCLDDDAVCLGCGRHLSEIVDWHQADAVERQAILVRAEQRRNRRAARREGGVDG